MSVEQKPLAWLPHSIAEASLTAPPGGDDKDLPAAWAHLLHKLERAGQIVQSDPASRNGVDLASGMRHLLVLLAAGIDEALRFDPDPILSVQRASTNDVITWGMECPDCIYTRASLRAGESYRLFGNRGTARYVGLQTMDGIVSTANELVDELELDADGNFEVILSPDKREGNWMQIEGDHPTLTVRHFFYDWDTEVQSSLRIERLSEAVEPEKTPVSSDVRVSRQLVALGDFVHDNLQFFLQFGAQRRRMVSFLRLTAPRWAQPRRTNPSSAVGNSVPMRRSFSKLNRLKAFTGVTRSGIRGGRPSITGDISPA